MTQYIDKQDIGIILIVIGIIIISFIIVLSQFHSKTIKGDCYDKYGSKILNQVCEVKQPDSSLDMAGVIGTLIFLIGIILFFFGMMETLLR